MIKGKLVTLNRLTKEDCHEFYKGYVPDKQMTHDEYRYEYKKIDNYFSIKTSEANRLIYGIFHDNHIVGEIQLKYINFDEAHGTLSIILKDDSVKGMGYGIEAEKLLLDYAFNQIKLNKVLADTTSRNKRSKHVLLKLGFKHIKDANEMSYYELIK